MSVDRSSALLVRVWLEGEGEQFRARVMAAAGGEASDVGDDRTIALVSSPNEVVAAIRGWLDDFIGGQPAEQ